MADNIQINTGTGPFIALDDIAGVLHQRIKVVWGTDGVGVDTSLSNPFPVQSPDLGGIADAAWAGSGSGSLIAVCKKMVAQLAAGFSLTGAVQLADAEGIKGKMGGITTLAYNATSLQRPADAVPYTAGDLVGNSTTGVSVVYPAIGSGGGTPPARVAGGSYQIDRARLVCSATTGLQGIPFRVRLWQPNTSTGAQAQVYSSGDNVTYGVTSGANSYIGSMSGSFEQFGDSAVAQLQPDYGSMSIVAPGGLQVCYWDMQTLLAFTPVSGAIFTLKLEVKQD